MGSKRKAMKVQFPLEINDKVIPVTRPLLPPLNEFIPYLEEIWDNKWLTNNGPFHQSLEMALADYLGLKHISLFANGTIALVTALKASCIEGEVITTPYSFVATAHALVWNNLTPVFADIDSSTYNLDPDRVEAAITPRTSAILPVHCYGRPCDTERIAGIARKHKLKLIYDAAHAFGVQDAGGSLLRHGDLSVLSFHATKVFNTFEGGAIISPNKEVKGYIDHLKNFGFVDDVTVIEVGINGKMNEVQSAFGLLQLKHLETAMDKRRKIDALYRNALEGVRGIGVLGSVPDTTSNYSYFPILVNEGYSLARNELHEKLKAQNIFSRRYFYPLISDMPMYKDMPSADPSNLPMARMVASQVICLPIYPEMTEENVNAIVRVIRANEGE